MSLPWTDGPTVRIACLSDAALITRLLHEFNGESLSPEAMARRMEQARGLETAFLGELEGRLAGILVLRTVPSLSGAEDWAEITELYVQPAFRRRGVGRALVEAAGAYSRGQGCGEIHLLVDPSNASALAFYGALEFRRDCWEMKRRL